MRIARMQGLMRPKDWYIAATEEEWLQVLPKLDDATRSKITLLLKRALEGEEMILWFACETDVKQVSSKFQEV